MGAGAASLALPALAGCGDDPSVQTSGDAPGVRRTAYTELVRQAIGPVEELWGRGAVPLPVRLHVPADSLAWARTTGQPARSDIPASTVTRDGVDTIVVHPAAWDRLTGAGRAAVITHEVTHLAQGSGGRAPWWLGEGSAEFTAHRASTRSPAQIAGPVWDRLVLDPPRQWPEPGAAGQRWPGYALAWSAALAVADVHGDEAVPRLHAAVAGSGDLDTGCRDVLGQSETQLRRAWAAWWAGQA